MIPTNPNLPHFCEMCGDEVGMSWDIHMILEHPETRPKVEPSNAKKAKGKRK